MIIGTANIRNFPDMPREKVAQDGQRMGRICDLWSQQENEPNEDAPVILRALGEGWSVALPNSDIPVYYQTAKLHLVGARIRPMPLKPDLPLVAKPRMLTGTTWRLVDRGSVAPFTVVNCHLIAGGMNGERVPARARQWRIEWSHLVDFVGEYKRKGLTVFVTGDFNHPRPPKPTTNFMWLVGPRLDRIGVTRTGGVEVEEIGDGIMPLNSDHEGQWSRVILSAGSRT